MVPHHCQPGQAAFHQHGEGYLCARGDNKSVQGLDRQVLEIKLDFLVSNVNHSVVLANIMVISLSILIVSKSLDLLGMRVRLGLTKVCYTLFNILQAIR